MARTGRVQPVLAPRDCFPTTRPEPPSLRFPEPRLRGHRESSPAPLEKDQGITPRRFCFLAGETTTPPSPLYFFTTPS